MNEKMKSIAMGQFAVASREQNVTLRTPAVQTCVALVLTSTHGVALAHIDTAFYASETVCRLIEKLKNLGAKSDDINATLIGGDIGLFFGSEIIYNSICNQLKKDRIPYIHKHYSIQSPMPYILTALYAAFNYFRLIGPASWPGFIICLTLCAAVENWVNNNVLIKSYDISVNSNSNRIAITENNTDNSEKIFNALSRDQKLYFASRSNINPTDQFHALRNSTNPTEARNIPDLKLQEITVENEPLTQLRQRHSPGL